MSTRQNAVGAADGPSDDTSGSSAPASRTPAGSDLVRPDPPSQGRKRRTLQRLIPDTTSPTYRALAGLRRLGDQMGKGWDRTISYQSSKRPPLPDPTEDDPRQLVQVRYEGRPITAEVVTQANGLDQHRAAVATVCAAAESGAVQIFGYQQSSTRVRIAVLHSDLPQLMTALIAYAAAPGPPISLGVLKNGGLRRLCDIQDFPEGGLARARTLVLGLPVVDPEQHLVLGITESVEIEVWSGEPDQTWTAPKPNRWCETLPPIARTPAQIPFGDVQVPSFESLAGPAVEDVLFPVDAVLTWVDDSDREWRKRHAEFAGSNRDWGTDAARFRNLDELRYSLRSLRMYTPWIRKIFVVTDGQSPSWLADSDQVEIVDHREIFPDPTMLPVFNSHAIESRLHHIPDLSEAYLYLNDDFFIGRELPPEAFFTPAGQAHFFRTTLPIGVGPAVSGAGFRSLAARNDRALLRQAVGRIQTSKLPHVPIPQLRSVALHLEQQFPEAYQRTSLAKFRSASDISPISLQSWYGYATGSFVASELSDRYFDLLTDDLGRRLRYLERHRHVDAFCLNMGETVDLRSEQNIAAVAPFLRAYYPFSAPWETST
ncbi:MAG: stealth family protein [Actinomycetia bacterium]|nr:stealth family protein [Actinomycetes bacterium]